MKPEKIRVKNAHATTLSVTVTKDLKHVLATIAKDMKVTQSQLIEHVLINYITIVIETVQNMQNKEKQDETSNNTTETK